MKNLFLSFTLAIAAAIGFMALSRAFDLDFYVSRVLPVVPIFYAISYEVLERRKKARLSRSATLTREEAVVAAAGVETGITARRIAVDVAISFVIKFSVELFLVSLIIYYSGQTFGKVYGDVTIETVGKFLRGEHPWFMGPQGIYFLAMVAVITSFATGSWIGHTSRGNAVLEGVLAGAAVSLVNSMTNMLMLYRTIEVTAIRLADSMGYVMRAGFLVVIALQVLLYGFWSGLVQMHKQEQAEMKKTGKRK
jgi:hypothetical protein